MIDETGSEGTSVADRRAARPWIRRHGWILAVAAAVVLIALIAGAPPANRSPLDPSSTAPDGTKALVLLLRSLGADVHIGPVAPADAHGVALVLQDDLNDADRSRLSTWVDAGGELVITDPASDLSGVAIDESTSDAIFGATGRARIDRACTLPALQQVRSIVPSGAILLRAAPGQAGCFAAGRGDVLVVREQGAGLVVVVGGAAPWVNANLNKADNGVLAATLLAPTAGTDVTFVGASRVGGGSQGLLALISPRLKEAFWGMIGAFFLIVLWRARRLGRPVPDVVPVELPGSGLVVATGNLLQEAGQRARAAEILRADLRRILADRLGVDAHLPPQTVAEVASARMGIDSKSLAVALAGPPPASDGELLALARTVETTRQEVVGAR
ncbi:MAG TPA: DUF4350 domain-containing protein [Acidimicrobiales bacterium]|nr:DUF4350 domain-containing protein [Acidimicrobiales bacterium]